MMEPVSGSGRNHPKIKKRGYCSPGDGSGTVELSSRLEGDCPQIETRAALSRNPAQEQRAFAQEQGRRSAMKRAGVQRTANRSAPQSKSGEDAVPSVPAPRRNASEKAGCNQGRPVHRTAGPEKPNTWPMPGNGKRPKTGQSARKDPVHASHHAVKTAKLSPQKAVKMAQQSFKAVKKGIKTAPETAQATVKPSQWAARAVAGMAAVKAAIAAVKKGNAAVRKSVITIAAGGWVAVMVVLVACLVGLSIGSIYGIFFADGSSTPGTVSPQVAVAQINRELDDTLITLQTGGSYDSVEIQGQPPSWADVFAVFTARAAGSTAVTVLDADRVAKLRTVFWDMTKITTVVSRVRHPASGDIPAWTETILTITITPRTPDDMRVFYRFTKQQDTILNELLTPASRAMWDSLLAGAGD